ncbi:MAG: acetyl-CoA decarbonylase/synthase complex subunit delta [Desulfobacterales bacterium]
MGFEIVKESYAGGIREISIGKGDKAITVGGETCYPFYQFEGDMPNKPKIAMEIWDMKPEDWPEAALAHFKDVVSDPAAWAKKCVDEFGAEAIVLQLKSIDPNGKNASPADAVATVKKVLGAVKVPLIIWGCANPQKDEEVLKKISEACDGENLTMGPVEDKNHKGIGASAMGFGHTLISSSPIDVNLAKQVNILLENLGMPLDRLIVDPTTGGLGYGLEYSYSVMERLRMAAMAQGDDKLQYPVINNLGNEVWKCKEAKLSAEDAPALGDPEKRAILMETIGAVTYLMAGSDILIMRHPEAIRMAKAYIDLLMDGGTANDVAPIAKKLKDAKIDYAAISPKPDLTIEEEKKAAPKKAAAKKAAPPKAAPKKAAPKKAAAMAAEPEAEAAPAPEPTIDAASQAKAEADAKIKTEMAAKDKAEADAKAKAEAEARAKADEEAKAKAAADAKAKADKEAVAKREEEENALRLKRAAEREKHAAERAKTDKGKVVSMTAAAEQKSQNEKIIEVLNRIHRRIALY